MSNNTSPEDTDIALVRKACQTLSEHFDSVQIFTTRYESGELDGTVNATYGLGNWFSRYGQIRNWLVKVDEETRLDVVKGREEE